MDTTDQFLLEDEDEMVVLNRVESGAAAAPHGGGSGDSGDDDGEGGEGGVETDPARLAQRQKQIAFGKNTPAYKNYVRLVPKHKRKLRGRDAHPATPDITLKASKRCWAGLVRKWRRGLHAFDPQPTPLELPPAATDVPLQQQHQQQHQQQQQQQQPHAHMHRQHHLQQQQHHQHHQHHHQHQHHRQQQAGAWQSSGAPRPAAQTGGVRKLTPSKRGGCGGGDDGDGARGGASGGDGSRAVAAARRDSPAKRPRGGDQQAAATAHPTGPAKPKAWADAVDDAFGAWTE